MSVNAVASSFHRGNGENWFALQVRANHEKVVQLGLRTKGYTEFLPLYRKRTRWSDRIKELELPLFPGYVFSKFPASSPLPILTIPGVVKIVGAGRTPVPIEESEVDAIRAVIGSGLPVIPWEFLHVGDRVRIESGSLTGIEGVLVQIKSQCRVVVSVPLLQRAVAVEVAREWIRPVSFRRAVPVQLAIDARTRTLLH